jgi:hypothetical protein
MNGNSKSIDIVTVRKSLVSRAEELTHLDCHLQAFCHWVSNKKYPAPVAITKKSAEILEKTLLTYQDIAFLGYLIDLDVNEPEETSKFNDGLKMLRGRKLFLPDQPQSFEQDRISQLGISLGILKGQAHAQDQISWLADDVLGPGYNIHKKGSVEHGLLAFILHICRKQELAPDTHLLILGILGRKSYFHPTDAQRKAIAEYILAPENWSEQPIDAALSLSVLDWLYEDLVTCLPTKATPKDVLSILENVDDTLRHWRWEEKPVTPNSRIAKWDISNEYHVQALLGLILEPIFHDLDDEEYLKSLGQKKPRADFAIPSLDLIIEVKFMRQGTQSAIAKVIEEVAADATLYLREDTPYKAMIVFIWDDSRSNDQHQELKNAINGMSKVQGTVIVSRPGRMN